MLQFLLYFVCLLLYVVTYFESKRRTANRLKEVVPLPGYPIIGSAHLVFPDIMNNYFKVLNNVSEKYGSKIYFEFDFKQYFLFSDPSYIQVS